MSFDDVTRLEFNKEEIDERKKQNETFHLPKSEIGFIDDHFGPRPGCIHTLMGSTGRGKSTLVQSLIASWGARTKILLYLTEESAERIEAKLALKEEDISYLSPKLLILHEHKVLEEINPNSFRLLLERLRKNIQDNEVKLLIIDNLTTSAFYENKFQNVMPFLTGLRQLAADENIPIFIVAHTKKGVSENTKGLMNPDDVRGSSMLANTSDYFYIFYRIRKTLEFGQPIDSAFVYVSKSRDHDNQDNLYKLEYDAGRKRYFRDKLVSFQIFKSFMKERDRV